MIKKTAIASLLLTLSGLAAAENLIENGSFENTERFNGKWSLLSELPGWQLTDNNGVKFEVQTTSLNIIDAQDGSQYVEMDSTNNYGMSQEVITEPGKDYLITLFYSPRMNNQTDTNQVQVLWNGQWIQTLTAATKGWVEHQFKVTANATLTTFELHGAGRSESYGGFIDNVSIEEIEVVGKSCEGGLYGINNYGSEDSGAIFHFDTVNGTTTKLAGVPSTASNISSNNGQLYFIEQLDSDTRESQILTYDISAQEVTEVLPTNSYPIYRSAVNLDGTSIRATSKTTIYDFDLVSGQKTVIGRMRFPGESFAHGDIEYSKDGSKLYVLTGQALYTVDTNTMELTEMFKHDINWASGLAIDNDNIAYVSGRKSGENAKIYSLDLQTGLSTELFETVGHINDLTFVDNFCE